MEAKIFTKVNNGSYKEYFKGSQKDVYALSAQLRERATSKGSEDTTMDAAISVHLSSTPTKTALFMFTSAHQKSRKECFVSSINSNHHDNTSASYRTLQ